MWNRWADLEASGDVTALRERFYVVDTAGLDERRTRDWIVTRCMINVGWQAAEGAPPGGGLGDPEEWITRNVTVAKAMQGLGVTRIACWVGGVHRQRMSYDQVLIPVARVTDLLEP